MTRLYAVFSSHALLPSPFRGSSLSARISEVRRRFSNNPHNFCCAQFLPPMRRTGAMPVAGSMPFRKGCMAHSFGFWLVGTPNTCVFRLPLCRQRSERLFLCLFLLIPRDEPLPDDYARIPIGIPPPAAPGAKQQRATGA